MLFRIGCCLNFDPPEPQTTLLFQLFLTAFQKSCVLHRNPKKHPVMSPTWSQNHSKICLGRPRDLKHRPGEQFWSRLGTMLERFWDPCSSDFGTQFGTYLKTAASPLLLQLRPSFSGSAGVRVSALNYYPLQPTFSIMVSVF